MNICLQHVSSAGLIPEPEEKAKLRKNWEYLSAGEATEGYNLHKPVSEWLETLPHRIYDLNSLIM